MATRAKDHALLSDTVLTKQALSPPLGGGHPAGAPSVVAVAKSDGAVYYVDSDRLQGHNLGRFMSTGLDQDRLLSIGDTIAEPLTSLGDEFGNSTNSYFAAREPGRFYLTQYNAQPSTGLFTVDEAATRTELWIADRNDALGTVLLPRKETASGRWLEVTLHRLGELLDLPDDWDGYSGRRSDIGLVVAAIAWLFRVMEAATPAPAVVPLSDGGLQLEWHEGGYDVEAVFTSGLDRGYFWENVESGEIHEGDLDDDIDDVRAVLAELG